MSLETEISGCASLESMLFGWDPDAATRRADAFVRAAVRRLAPARRESAFEVPEFGGTYSRRGGETTIVRANDAALALARHSRAA
ncbi:MAG: hypothetical protein JNK45_33550 [Myxococcales bacterium]|nr:hypothetical protein [Myxococcales bacterium]